MKNRTPTSQLPDIYDIWDYSSPTETRKRFKELLPQATLSPDVSYLLQLQTQIARTYSLESKFNSAHEILDEVEPLLTKNLALAKIRYLLERGRTFNSAGDKAKALGLFTDAYTLCSEHQEDFHAVDAAHMIAIATPESSDKEKWNLLGVKIAEDSDNTRAHDWLGSLYNNIGWDYFEQKRYPEALEKFGKALKFQVERGARGKNNSERINIARWCVAKGYRFVNRVDEALEIQNTLLSENEQSGTSDGFVFEELGELYLLKKDARRSQKFFAEAFRELSQDAWLVKNESERLARLKTLGATADTTKQQSPSKDPTMKLNIRKATKADTPLLLALIKNLAEYEKLLSEVNTSEQELGESLFSENPAAEALIGEYKGQPVGFAIFFHNFSTFLGKRGLYLEDLFIKPEFRGKGFGKEMLVRLAQIAKERNCGRFEWAVLDWNESAIGFYKKLGALPLEDWRVFRLTGEALHNLANQS